MQVQALIWFFDEMSSAGQRIEAGQFLTTGACVTPIPVQPGQTLRADFGWLGAMTVRFVDEAGDPRNGSTPSQRVGERHVQGPL